MARRRVDADVQEETHDEVQDEALLDEEQVEPEQDDEPEPEQDDGVIRVNVNFERQGKFIICTDRNFHPAIYRSKGRTPITFDRERAIKVWGSDDLQNAEIVVNGHPVRLGRRFRNEWFYAILPQDVIDAIVDG